MNCNAVTPAMCQARVFFANNQKRAVLKMEKQRNAYSIFDKCKRDTRISKGVYVFVLDLPNIAHYLRELSLLGHIYFFFKYFLPFTLHTFMWGEWLKPRETKTVTVNNPVQDPAWRQTLANSCPNMVCYRIKLYRKVI